MKFLHSMIRVSDPAATVAFFQLLGLEERRRMENEQGRFTLIFLGVPGDEGGEVELTHNWDEMRLWRRPQLRPPRLSGRRHLRDLPPADGDGVTINRPPRDGRMAFVRTPDEISVELLQKGAALAAAEPWASMPNTGEW